MIIILDFDFSSAHFYNQKKWSPKKNQKIFGRCFTKFGHGHNYKLQLEIDIAEHQPSCAKLLIQEAVTPTLKPLDHEHLNLTIPYFKNIVPTTENISLYLRDQIKIPGPYHLCTLRLFEMDSLFVELSL